MSCQTPADILHRGGFSIRSFHWSGNGDRISDDSLISYITICPEVKHLLKVSHCDCDTSLGEDENILSK